MQFIPRGIYFKNGKATGTQRPHVSEGDSISLDVIFLPTDHYDFIGPIKVQGKSKEDIEAEAESFR